MKLLNQMSELFVQFFKVYFYKDKLMYLFQDMDKPLTET
jgi:hypothetical protein